MKIKDWSKYQHYHNRKPPWIKLYRDLLDDPEFHALSGDASKLLAMCWLIASEDETLMGNLPKIEKLSFRVRMSIEKVCELIVQLKHWIVMDASDLLALRYHVAIPETERETETDLNFSNEKFLIGDPITSLGSSQNLTLLSAPTSLTKADQTNIKKSKTKRKKAEPSTDGSRVFDAYARAYKIRYGIEPVRNAKQNSICKTLVKRLGAADALGVAEYYPSVRNSYDSARGHSLAMLLQDCEKHVTAWKTGRQITQHESREQDRLQKDAQEWAELIEKYGDGSSKRPRIVVGESTVQSRVQQK